MNMHIKIYNYLKSTIDDLEVTVPKSWKKHREDKHGRSNYNLGEGGIDLELLEMYLISTGLVDKKDTNNKYWPDYNKFGKRIDNKRLNKEGTFNLTREVIGAIEDGLIDYFCFFNDNQRWNYPEKILLKEGDVVKHKFHSIVDAQDLLREYPTGGKINIDKYLKKSVHLLESLI